MGQDVARVAAAADGVPGTTLREGIVYHAITPATPNSCHYFFAHTIKTPVASDADVEMLTDKIGAVIAEDIFAAEQIERMVGRRDELKDLMTAGDNAVVRGRLMLERLIKAEREAHIDRC